MRNSNVGILGGGSWGTTVASLVARNASALLWARNDDTVREINDKHTNSRYLGEAALSRKLSATSDLHGTVSQADVLVIAIPSQSFRSILNEVKDDVNRDVPIVSLTKGLELDTQMRMTEVIQEVLPDNPRAILTGPNLAREIIAGFAAASVLAMEDQTIIISKTINLGFPYKALARPIFCLIPPGILILSAFK